MRAPTGNRGPVWEVRPIRIGANLGNVLVIVSWAILGVVVVIGGLRWLSQSGIPYLQPAAKGLVSVVDYAKAA